MGTIASYPEPSRALADSDLLLGDAGETASIRMDAVASYIETKIIPQLLSMLAQSAAGLVDVNGGAPPAGPAIYLDGGALKYIPGA